MSPAAAALVCAAVAVVPTVSGCGGAEQALPQPEPSAAPCAPPYPESVSATLDLGSHRSSKRTGDAVVGLALRDESATVVGFCVSGERIPSPLPALEAGGRRIEPVGGTYTREGPASFNYVYYPPTRAGSIAVVQGEERLAELRFSEPRSRPCPIEGSDKVRVIACGAVVLADWASPLRIEPSALELLDGEVWQDDDRTLQLGFLFQGARWGADGRLVIRFGFRPPSGNQVTVAIRGAYLGRQGSARVDEVVIDPPATATVRLSRRSN